MTTTYTKRTGVTSTWDSRDTPFVWVDYLLDDTGDNILDDTSDKISIYSTTGYERSTTERDARTAI